jgi:hypothetical protein
MKLFPGSMGFTSKKMDEAGHIYLRLPPKQGGAGKSCLDIVHKIKPDSDGMVGKMLISLSMKPWYLEIIKCK